MLKQPRAEVTAQTTVLQELKQLIVSMANRGGASPPVGVSTFAAQAQQPVPSTPHITEIPPGGDAATDCGAELVVCGGGGEGGEEVDMRLHAIVHRLDCTSNVGWCRIMGYATAEECMRTYAQLCVAFGPGARVKLSAWAAANNGRRLPPHKHTGAYVRRARRVLLLSDPPRGGHRRTTTAIPRRSCASGARVTGGALARPSPPLRPLRARCARSISLSTALTPSPSLALALALPAPSRFLLLISLSLAPPCPPPSRRLQGVRGAPRPPPAPLRRAAAVRVRAPPAPARRSPRLSLSLSLSLSPPRLVSPS